MQLLPSSFSALKPSRIIVADDHEWIRNILVDVVRQTLPDADILAYEDGAKALDSYRESGCDFLVTNHMMPHLDGTGLIRKVREIEPRLPILMVSVKPEAKADAMLAGASWFLTKEQIMEGNAPAVCSGTYRTRRLNHRADRHELPR